MPSRAVFKSTGWFSIQTHRVIFDRDLLAMRTYFDCGLIDVGVIVTRTAELNNMDGEAHPAS